MKLNNKNKNVLIIQLLFLNLLVKFYKKYFWLYKFIARLVIKQNWAVRKEKEVIGLNSFMVYILIIFK